MPGETGARAATGPTGTLPSAVAEPTSEPAADPRLVGPAVAAWSSTALCLWLPGVATLLLTALLAVGTLLSIRRRQHLLALALVVAAAAAPAAGLRVAQAQAGMLPRLAADEVIVDAVVVLAGDPRTVETAFGDQVFVKASARVVTGRGRTVRGRAPVVLIAGLDVGLQDIRLGSRVALVGRLAPSDSNDLAALLRVSRLGEVRTAPAWWWTMASGVRDGVRGAVDNRGMPGELVPALVVGDDSGLSTDVADDFRASGLTHLLAVSGTNLTLVLGALLLVARWSGVRGRGLVITGVLGAVGFVLLARPDPSVVRAAAMGLVALAGLTSGDRRRGLRALCVAVIVLLLVNPWLARSVGFVLSVLATAAILVLAPPWRDALTRWLPRWAAEAVAVPMAAQLACTPVIAAISGQASIVAVLANVLAAPAVGPATVAGLAAGLFAVAVPPAGDLLGWFAVAPAWWIVAVGRVCADLPGASLEWGTSPGALAALTALCLLLATVAGSLLRRRWLAVLATVLLVGVVLRPLPSPGWPPDGWVAVACDVGQGDGLVLSAGDDVAVVVDVGPDPAAISQCLSELGVRRVSAVLVTHLHADHVAGLSGVFSQVRVAEVDVGPVRSPADSWRRVVAAATAAGVPVRTVSAGEVAGAGAISWRVLWPPPGTPADLVDSGESGGSPVNDASLVLAVDVGGVRLLLTGDIEPPTQAALVRSGVDLSADVLKVPHHGSSRQDAAFLDAVGAELAVVSVGTDNTYGHPAPDLLAGLDADGVEVARTDVDGAIALVADGSDVSVVTR
ncbi:ComEC/Rec2 family competence protein [soil metagenome]